MLNASIAELVGEVPVKPATHAQRLEVLMAGLSLSDCDWIETIVGQLAEHCKRRTGNSSEAAEPTPASAMARAEHDRGGF